MFFHTDAGDRIRTCEPTERQAPEACAFDHLATPAKQQKEQEHILKLY